MRLPIPCILLLLSAAHLSASEPTPAAPPGAVLDGHSSHGEAFDEGPRQSAYLMDGMPKIVFPISTTNEMAQKFFLQGVGQLHGFWYFEAERSFRQAAALDPDCAMLYWGMAMANIKNGKRATEFIKKAQAMKKSASRREVLWIDSLADFYQKKKDDKDKRRELVKALENLSFEFPGDLEAKAFLVFQLWDNSQSGIPLASTQALDSLANEVLAREPLHPIHHYRIHMWDVDKAERGLNSCTQLGPTGPGIAHMWHMPGHIYAKLNRYLDCTWHQEASARTDHAQMMRDRLMPDQIHNYAHNNDWLVQNLYYVGRVREAIDLAKNMIELPRLPKFSGTATPDGIKTYDAGGSSFSYGRKKLFDVFKRFEMWEQLIALRTTVYLETTEQTEERARLMDGLGVAYFALKQTAQGKEQLAALEALLKEVQAEQKTAGAAAEAKSIADQKKASEEAEKAAQKKAAEDAEKAAKEPKKDAPKEAVAAKETVTPEAKAVSEKKSEETAKKAKDDAIKSFDGKIKTIEKYIAELKIYQALAEKDLATSRKLLESAKDISQERLAQLWFEVGDKEKAEKQAREGCEKNKGQFHALANYADILKRCGKPKEMQEQLEKLRPMLAYSDADLPILKRLGMNSSMLPSSDDVRRFPDLSARGPFRWQPMPALDWTLPDASGQSKRLADYRGKPVIVIFYLGNKCSHCMEQLGLFAPMTKDFADAGISIVAISLDSIEDLKTTFIRGKPNEKFPFPLLSDTGLGAFKAYRAYDDFEKMALHGTYLIDGAGLLRWQEISFTPFREPTFLLAEAKRLLSLPVTPTAQR